VPRKADESVGKAKYERWWVTDLLHLLLRLQTRTIPRPSRCYGSDGTRPDYTSDLLLLR
jgi:hypothetical protein